MITFMLMTKLATDIAKRMKERASIGKEWINKVKEKCPGVRFISHYGLLGQYDFVDIYEAPDVETAAKVSMISLASGALQAESWVAIPYKKLLDLADEI